MKLIIFFSAILAYAAATPLVGSNKCTWGPGYWCSHVSHAKECGAMEHCMDRFWPKQEIETEASASCTVCKLAISELRQSLKNHATEKDVSSFLARFCTVLPADEKQKCKQMALNNLPEILQMLDSKISSEVVCAAIDFCKEQGTAINQQPAATTPAPGKICSDCETLVQDIKDVMTDNQTVGEVIQMLEQVICARMGPLESICKNLVDQYVPQYFKALSSFVDPQMICTVLGFCQNGDALESNLYLREKLAESLRSVIQDNSETGEACEICTTFATDLQLIIKDKNIQADIVNFVEGSICSKIGPLSSMCKQYVDQYQSLFFDALISVLDPETVCKDLRLCSAAGQVPTGNLPFDVAILKPEDMLVKYQPEVSMKKIIPAEKLEDSLPCEVCQLLMAELKSILGENKTEANIEKVLDEVCNLLTGQLKTECLALVQEYGPEIINLIINDVDFDQICSKIGLCSQTALKEVHIDAAGPTCAFCEKVVEYVQNLLKDNKTDQVILAKVEELCNLLPDSTAAQCRSLIENYGQQMLEYLIDSVDPKKVCQLVSLCPQNMESAVPKNNAGICDVCELLVTEAKSILNNNMTEEEMVAELKKICAVLPSTMKDQCDQIIDAYFKSILDLIRETDAHTLCIDLGLCTNMNVNMQQAVPKVEDGLCDVCQLLVTEAKTILTGNKTEDELIAELKQICTVLPAEMKDQCDQLIDVYGKMVLDLILQMDSKTLCSEIGLCSSIKKKPALKSNTGCVVCKMVAAGLDYLLQENSTAEEIKKALDVVCDLIGPELSNECRNFTSQYEAAIISILVAELKPDKICTELKLCDKTVASTVKKTTNVKGTECILCEFVMRELDQLIANNKSVAFIEKALEEVCSFLPSTIRDQCDAFVEDYGSAILQLLEQELDPKQVCTLLGLCSVQRGAWKPPKPMDDSTLYFNQKLLGTEECTHGPSFWCASHDNAKKCNAEEYCLRAQALP